MDKYFQNARNFIWPWFPVSMLLSFISVAYSIVWWAGVSQNILLRYFWHYANFRQFASRYNFFLNMLNEFFYNRPINVIDKTYPMLLTKTKKKLFTFTGLLPHVEDDCAVRVPDCRSHQRWLFSHCD